MFGPLGTLIGAAAGVVAGAAAGKGVAERLDPTVETEYWRQEHRNRPYYKEGTDYDRDYATVYGFGLQARETRPTSTWEETEATLAGEWPRNRGNRAWNGMKPGLQHAMHGSVRTVPTLSIATATRITQAASTAPATAMSTIRTTTIARPIAMACRHGSSTPAASGTTTWNAIWAMAGTASRPIRA